MNFLLGFTLVPLVQDFSMKKASCCCDGRVDTVGFKLAEGKGLRDGWRSKELWKSVEKAKA